MEYPDIVTNTWSVEDVDTWLESSGEVFLPPFDEKEKRKVLFVMQEDFDANHGFNWDTLGAAVRKVAKEREGNIE